MSDYSSTLQSEGWVKPRDLRLLTDAGAATGRLSQQDIPQGGPVCAGREGSLLDLPTSLGVRAGAEP